jgi:hypothetical protein
VARGESARPTTDKRHVIRSAALSPYITTHLTRFGRYSLDLARGAATLDDDLPILSTQPRAKGRESCRAKLLSNGCPTQESVGGNKMLHKHLPAGSMVDRSPPRQALLSREIGAYRPLRAVCNMLLPPTSYAGIVV